MSSRARLLIALSALSACGYLTLALAGDLRTRPGLYLAVHAALFVIYLAGLRESLKAPRHGDRPRETDRVILWAAVVFRLILLPAAPGLSDDIYRYIWEGGLQLEGINPYAHAPSDPELASRRDAIYDRVNYKDLPAIYPPVAQWAGAAGALMGRTTTGMKLIMAAADVALILALRALLAALGVPAAKLLVYAWNPIAVVEVAGSGHNDPLALFFLVAATLGIIGKRRVLSTTALGMSALCKLFPLALLPLFARRVRPWQILVPPALLAAGYLPYAAAGGNLFRSLFEYGERWRHNDSLFGLLVRIVEGSGLSPVAKGWADARGFDSLYTQPHMIARIIAATIAAGTLAALTARQWRTGDEPSRAIFLFTATALALQPTLHPWYLLWILPWLAIHPSPAWIALSGLVPLSYLDAPWVVWVEYVPFYGILAAGWLAATGPGRRVIEFARARRGAR